MDASVSALPVSSSIEALLAHLIEALPGHGGDPSEFLVHEQQLPANPPAFEILRPRLPAALGAAIQARGIRQLYRHQVEAIQAVRAGQHVVIRTPTASGKTFAFSLPTLERILQRPGSHALYLYPTKALANDQLRGLRDLLAAIHVDGRALRAESLSGDTPRAVRDRLQYDPPDILLANPDILHHHVLPGHERWAGFLRNLEVVVLDEMHANRGVFGSHVGLVLRRLRRLAGRHGAHPSFIAASATIANPAELAEQLVGLPFTTISGEAAGSSSRRFILWRPPLIGSEAYNQHRSATAEAVGLFVELLKAGRTTILFGKSRSAVERMFLQAREALDPELAAVVSAYKSGYKPTERERIENDLRAGKMRGVVATNALELGINIGYLDACVLAGYPGTVMSTWQQAGRVGRTGADDEAIIILVGADDALDAYYLTHPEAFFGAPHEQAVVDPSNESMLLGHLLCAAKEAPLRADELDFFPEASRDSIERLAREGLLTGNGPWTCASSELPHSQVSIRGVSRNQYLLLVGEQELGTIEPPQLYREAHEGAQYLHNGRAYRVERVDDEAHHVILRPDTRGGRTDPLADVRVFPQGEAAQVRELEIGQARVRVTIGPLLAQESVHSYRETPRGNARRVVHAIEPPHVSTLNTIGLWIDIPEKLDASTDALHAAEHALVNALPIVLLCDRRDLGSAHERLADCGRVYLYDGYEGGVGLSEKAYLHFEDLIAGATALLRDCVCHDGCPSCVHMPGCTQANAHLDKAGGLAILEGRAIRPVQTPHRTVERRQQLQGPTHLGNRMRQIAEESLRSRLKAVELTVGEVVELKGVGEVVIMELDGTRAKVRFVGFSTWSWVEVSQLKRAR